MKFPVQNYVLIGANAKNMSFFVHSFDKHALYDTAALAKKNHEYYLFLRIKEQKHALLFSRIFDKTFFLNFVRCLEFIYFQKIFKIFSFFQKLALQNFFLIFFEASSIFKNSLFSKKIFKYNFFFFDKALLSKLIYFFLVFGFFGKNRINSFFVISGFGLNLPSFRFYYKNSFKNLFVANSRFFAINKILYCYYKKHVNGLIYLDQQVNFNASKTRMRRVNSRS